MNRPISTAESPLKIYGRDLYTLFKVTVYLDMIYSDIWFVDSGLLIDSESVLWISIIFRIGDFSDGIFL